MEEDCDFSSLFQPFPDATNTFCDFYNRNLQTIQALKGKSNLKQAYPKCNYTSSSITQKIALATTTITSNSDF
jgi:hypothetical protein